MTVQVNQVGKVWAKSVWAAVCPYKTWDRERWPEVILHGGKPVSLNLLFSWNSTATCSMATDSLWAAYESSSGLLRSWLSINTLIFMSACMKCIININKGTNTLMYVHICQCMCSQKGLYWEGCTLWNTTIRYTGWTSQQFTLLLFNVFF